MIPGGQIRAEWAGQNWAENTITPADAGNSRYAILATRQTGDHPRGCGEQAFSIRAIYKREGSPPRMRGTEMLAAATTGSLRITPADAGNSSTYIEGIPVGKDHPRGCGEQQDLNPILSNRLGSPPRMRGTVCL